MKRLAFILLAVRLGSAAAADSVSFGEAHGPPEGLAEAPVLLEASSPLAGVELRINIDLRHLVFLGAVPGADAAGFTITSRQDPSTGQLLVVASRAEAPGGFSGELLRLRFQVNPGSQRGYDAEITLAQATLAGVFGQPAATPLDILHGVVEIDFSTTVDTDGDGLMDYDEQFLDGQPGYNPFHPTENPTGTDTDVEASDTDRDGLDDGDEAIAGTNAVDPGDVLGLRLNFVPPVLRATWDARPGVHYRIFAFETPDPGSPANLVLDNLQPPAGPHTQSFAPADTDRLLYYRVEAYRP